MSGSLELFFSKLCCLNTLVREKFAITEFDPIMVDDIESCDCYNGYRDPICSVSNEFC